MTDTCETVKVKTDDDYMVINKCDLTKDHVLFSDKPKSKKKESKKSK